MTAVSGRGIACMDGGTQAEERRRPMLGSPNSKAAPELPQPAAKALAVPTTLAENMQEVQNWQHTKEASAKPMKQRDTINPAELVTMDMANTAHAAVERHEYHEAFGTAAMGASFRSGYVNRPVLAATRAILQIPLYLSQAMAPVP